MNIDLNSKYSDIVKLVSSQAPFKPEICIILGSGLGDFAEKIKTVISIPTASLPGYPKSTVQGHSGYFHFSEYKGKKLFVVQGRIHPYEGYPISECVLPVHVASKLGCGKIFLTNAAGGVNPQFSPGDLMLMTSLNGMNIKKELSQLIGITDINSFNRFINFPSEIFADVIREAAKAESIMLREGTYWYTKGPSYETPSEIRMAGIFDGDAVGMSTVHEAVYASVCGMEVSGISCITNFAAGLSPVKLSHNEVMETAERVKADFERLVKKIIELA